MTPIVACVNLKGGVGKTAVAVNFAQYCGIQKGLDTLLIDLDPQTNATFCCMSVEDWEMHSQESGTVANLLGARNHSSAEGGRKTFDDVVARSVFEHVDLIPSHLDLFTIDLDLASATARERKLKKAVSPVVDNYDIIVCDCPPNLTIPTQNALALATHYVVPISPDFLSALGVGILLNRIEELSDDLDNELSNAGIVISRVGRRAIHRRSTVAALRAQFGEDVLTQQLTELVDVPTAAEAQESLYKSNTKAAREFGAMSDELLERLGIDA